MIAFLLILFVIVIAIIFARAGAIAPAIIAPVAVAAAPPDADIPPLPGNPTRVIVPSALIAPTRASPAGAPPGVVAIMPAMRKEQMAARPRKRVSFKGSASVREYNVDVGEVVEDYTRELG